MTKYNVLFLSAVLLALSGEVRAEEIISQSISGDACDDRLTDDGEQTAENRAVDKAGLSAVKLSGIIQRNYPDLSTNAIDTIAYRIIDEYMVNTAHAVKLSDADRVCVKFMADVEMSTADLEKLVDEYKDSDAPAEQIAEVVKQVEENTAFKPRNLEDKKLLYIKKMVFKDGTETSHYEDLLTGLFSNSEYFYVTKDKSVADFILTPRLSEAVVGGKLKAKNHIMRIAVELETVFATGTAEPIVERQNHFTSFARDKDEQKLADDLVRKLLTNASKEMSRKIDKYSAEELKKARFKQ